MLPLALGLVGEGGVGLALPADDRFRVLLVGAPQRLLRGQPDTGQERPHRDQAQRHAEPLPDQLAHDPAGLQPDVEPVPTRVLAVDLAKHLPLLSRRQRSSPPRRLVQPHGPLTLATFARLPPHLVRPVPIHPKGGRDRRR